MEQKSRYRYEAKKGEKACFEVTPTKVAPLVVAADNGVGLENIGTPQAPKFEVSLQESPVFVHSIDINCTFPPESPPRAMYRIVVCDGSGNVWKNVPAVRPTDPPDVVFTITIV